MKFIVSNGAAPESAYNYKNANYALLRLLIAEVWASTSIGGAPYSTITESNHSLIYRTYVQ